MANLKDKVALVTGASRGVGKGIALGLGEAGASVYITGRTVEAGQAAISPAVPCKQLQRGCGPAIQT
jgi:NAD(P)-dependent dehydrogenase (short-subunit alcohol dehydrogenase family)